VRDDRLSSRRSSEIRASARPECSRASPAGLAKKNGEPVESTYGETDIKRVMGTSYGGGAWCDPPVHDDLREQVLHQANRRPASASRTAAGHSVT
jgi:hypothetical protein